MLKARIITALLLLAGFLISLFWFPFSAWMVLACAVAGVGAWEWGQLIKLDRLSCWGYAAGAVALCFALALAIFEPTTGAVVKAHWLTAIFALAALYWVVFAPLWLATNWQLPNGFLGMLLGVVILVPASLALMQLRAITPFLLLASMALVWVADISAYFCGRAFGKHKLAPTISPGKTWEGALGGLLGVMVYGFILAIVALKIESVAAFVGFSRFSISVVCVLLLALLVLTALSIAGDLFESMAKRQANVKDSSNLLPGHGGVLDRADSLLSTLPLVGLTALYFDSNVARQVAVQWIETFAS